MFLTSKIAIDYWHNTPRQWQLLLRNWRSHLLISIPHRRTSFETVKLLPITQNGIHLTAEGYAHLASDILPETLFAPMPDNADLDAIKVEVLEKNRTFFDWYRTVNSFYIHGDRKAPYGQVNFPKEREKLLQMTALRDQRIWKVAKGESVPAKIDDTVTVSIPATLPGSRGGTSTALNPSEEKDQFDVAEGFQIELFASEEDFAELRNPVAINFDAKGRLWVATMPSYPHALPGVKPNDQIIILEDTDGDGRADQRKVFAENLYLPLSFEFGDGGLFVSQEPNLVFLADTDGDDRADKQTLLLHGFGSEDCHHAIHNFVWGPGGGLYMHESVFQHTQVETIHGPRRHKDNGVYRYDPRTMRFEVVARLAPGGNPWGHTINRWGEHLFVGGFLNGKMINCPDGVFLPNPRRLNGDSRYCGQEFITSRHWPDHFQGKVFPINTKTTREPWFTIGPKTGRSTNMAESPKYFAHGMGHAYLSICSSVQMALSMWPIGIIRCLGICNIPCATNGAIQKWGASGGSPGKVARSIRRQK